MYFKWVRQWDAGAVASMPSGLRMGFKHVSEAPFRRLPGNLTRRDSIETGTSQGKPLQSCLQKIPTTSLSSLPIQLPVAAGGTPMKSLALEWKAKKAIQWQVWRRPQQMGCGVALMKWWRQQIGPPWCLWGQGLHSSPPAPGDFAISPCSSVGLSSASRDRPGSRSPTLTDALVPGSTLAQRWGVMFGNSTKFRIRNPRD